MSYKVSERYLKHKEMKGKEIDTCLIENWMLICKWIKENYHFCWRLKIRIAKDLELVINVDEKKIYLEAWYPGFHNQIKENKDNNGHNLKDFLEGKRSLSENDIKILKELLSNWPTIKEFIKKENEVYFKLLDFKV